MQRYAPSIKNEGPHPLADEDEDDALFEDRFSIAYNLDREFGCVYMLFAVLIQMSLIWYIIITLLPYLLHFLWQAKA